VRGQARPDDEAVAGAVISALPPAVSLAILTPGDREAVRRQAGLLRARGVELLLEATSLDEARLAVALGFDGVIARGHEAGGASARRPRWSCSNSSWRRWTYPCGPRGGSASTPRRRAPRRGRLGWCLTRSLP